MRISIFVFLLSPFFCFAQQPEIFEPGLISTHGVFGFTLSPEGNEAFWVRSNGKRDTLVIMHSHRVKGKWQTPEIASFSTTTGAWKDIDPVFSPDGNMVLFQSNRPVEDKPNRKGFDIWASKRLKKGWSTPYHLGNTINSDESESFASMTNHGSIYFMKENPNQKGQSDIYVSHFLNGRYTEPVNLGFPINTDFRESNPFISPKEDFILYFSSDSTGYGDVDLYISYRNNGEWSTPKNLGQPINSSIGEFCPFYHFKQRKLYFCRIELKTGGGFIEDIYVVSFDPFKE